MLRRKNLVEQESPQAVALRKLFIGLNFVDFVLIIFGIRESEILREDYILFLFVPFMTIMLIQSSLFFLISDAITRKDSHGLYTYQFFLLYNVVTKTLLSFQIIEIRTKNVVGAVSIMASAALNFITLWLSQWAIISFPELFRGVITFRIEYGPILKKKTTRTRMLVFLRIVCLIYGIKFIFWFSDPLNMIWLATRLIHLSAFFIHFIYLGIYLRYEGVSARLWQIFMINVVCIVDFLVIIAILTKILNAFQGEPYILFNNVALIIVLQTYVLILKNDMTTFGNLDITVIPHTENVRYLTYQIKETPKFIYLDDEF
ncbi:hypothetical protein EDEG_02823 [Edhazardia aedis USNM 41457]|uniref:Uncharacterized protein n=1 Tax=Edhazardia aedis (strain USNM 41457) TaxID=1003232 RepID=J8ZSZ0_EDHAE|nr:hypothetical protein EDEG_02823 [Edhazardia aedis USNM 41457]|eukprot:EJW02783.1 hypothetical protein EDEG_02823 [Edhazardia aedis USNM 41457]